MRIVGFVRMGEHAVRKGGARPQVAEDALRHAARADRQTSERIRVRSAPHRHILRFTYFLNLVGIFEVSHFQRIWRIDRLRNRNAIRRS